jgi:hypothetical protein
MALSSSPLRRALFLATILAGALAARAMAQAPDAACPLPSGPEGIPAALDRAVTGPADQDRACMKALVIPEGRLTFLSTAADGTSAYRIETVDDWAARMKARGHAVLEETQDTVRMEHAGNLAQVWTSYTLQSDGKPLGRGINAIQAIKTTGGWRIAAIMVQAEAVPGPSAKQYLP